MKRQLHPGARWQFRINGYAVMFFLSFFLSWFIAPIFVGFSILMMGGGQAAFSSLFLGILIFILFYTILAIIVAEIYARMSYNRWFYEFTNEQLRLERGIIWKRYSNVPYERVQNVDITRGIIARLCGFSTVNIQTAGFAYSANRGIFAEGYIPAVTIQEAEHIREFLMSKISRSGRRQGL